MRVAPDSRMSRSAEEPVNPVRYRMFASDNTSSPSSPAAPSRASRAAWRASRASATAESRYQRLQCQNVSHRAESGDDTESEIRQAGVPPFRLARKNVGE